MEQRLQACSVSGLSLALKASYIRLQPVLLAGAYITDVLQNAICGVLTRDKFLEGNRVADSLGHTVQLAACWIRRRRHLFGECRHLALRRCLASLSAAQNRGRSIFYALTDDKPAGRRVILRLAPVIVEQAAICGLVDLVQL